MKAQLWYQVVVRDRHGKVISRERHRSRSYVVAWNQLMCAQMSAVAQTIKDTGGTNRAIAGGKYNFKMSAPDSTGTYGIVVGTGDTAVTINDYQLETLIVQGFGAGQMDHLEMTVDAAVVASPNASFSAHRSIVNNSGGPITVKETGIYVQGANGAVQYFLGIRDVLVTPQLVADGGAITVDYTMQVTE